MTQPDDAGQECVALREPAATLSAAILRINASLDLDTVFGEAVAGACVLAGARYGAIVAVDEVGAPQAPVFSGLAPEEEREQLAWPGNAQLFEHLRALPGPLRSADFPACVRDLGIDAPWTVSETFLGMPMRHRGAEFGHFFLAGKADGEAFTDGDEEVLELFASQAASAIANARTLHSERRARADLEALVETSPVGVVVFDAKSGRPVSFNREMRRIVESLRMPGHPPEQLLEVLSFRRADGRVFSLSEVPVAQLLSGRETLRAEEMTLSVPDGRRVRTLINAKPILSEGDAVGSMVVTVQDLAPLDEIERLRTEFLGLVSHELREPLAAIKGSAATLLEEAPTLDPAEMREFHRLIGEQADHMRGLIGDLLDAGRIEAGTLSVSPEPSDAAGLVERARATFQGGGARHGVVVDLPSDLPQVMADRRRVVQVLNNLLSNAARNAPESTEIRVSAVREDDHVSISVADEGRGLAPERVAHLFRKHAAPGDGGREGRASGHGLGLAICKGLVEAHGGRIRAESAGPGLGTTVVFTLPAADEAGGKARGASRRPSRQSGEGSGPARILVVDDDPRTLRLVRDALSSGGYAPVVTGDPGEIKRILRVERPALVVLDLALPGADGVELMTEIPELADLPVIFVSAYGRDETVARALDAGAADYVVKPFSPAELTARVRAALRRRERPAPFVRKRLKHDVTPAP
ncbi:MAG: response regulator [Boseongicola sp.]|nr:response regulator [Boseongicola sp.]